MDIPDIATLFAGSTIPLCVGIASLAVGCVLKYSKTNSKPEFFEPRCNDDYVQLKRNLRAGTHSTPVLVQGRVTKAENKGTFGGMWADPVDHNIEATIMKDKGPSVAGKAMIDKSRGNYADVSEITFSIPFHLKNNNIESVHKDKNIILTVVEINKSQQFTEVLQKWPDKTSKRENYDILPYGSTIAILGTARLDNNEITIFPTIVGKSVQSLFSKESNIGPTASNATSNVASNSDVTNALLVVGGVLIAVGIGFFMYKIWKARKYHSGREENRKAVDGGNSGRDGGDDYN